MAMLEANRILDVLGNRNRRAILALLSQRPCYVSEIAELLDVGPKAIIDHLRLLEETGLIINRANLERRKYYQIADNLRLEVRLSPFIFDMDLQDLMVTSDERRRLRDELLSRSSGSVGLNYIETELRRLHTLQDELCDAQKSVQALMDEAMRLCTESIERITRDQIEAELLFALMRGQQDAATLSRTLRLPPGLVEDGLAALESHGLVHREGEMWRIA
jgi:ArsR family transcriptional regulator